MPEGDRFERSFKAGWRSAIRLVREGVGSEDEVADKLVASLAETLRDEKGVPCFPEMLRVITKGETRSLLDSFNDMDEIVRDSEGHRHTQIASDVAKSLLVQMDVADGMDDFALLTLSFSEHVCSALLDHYFFGRAYPQLVAEGRFGDYEDAMRWQNRVERIMQPNITKLADRLVHIPDAEGLRAPKRIVPKESTSNLLDTNLLFIGSTESDELPL